MPLAYHSLAADREFGSEHCGGHSVEELLGVAHRWPLARRMQTPVLPRLLGTCCWRWR
jgi:hypothetical protein